MKIFRQLPETHGLPGPVVVTIGNFDGVHLAHRQLFGCVASQARALGGASGAVTFDPHPARVLHPHAVPAILTPLREKIRLIEQTGLDFLVILEFTRDLSELSPDEFVRELLLERLRARAVCVGSNFRFGYRKAGDARSLAELGHRLGFEVETLPILQVRGERVSSTRIRQLLAEGTVGRASRLLGRPFSIRGPVVPGLGLGRRKTAPTLNLAPTEQALPKMGVYITRTHIGRSTHGSVTNIGHKPTFGDHPLAIETHLLDAERQLEAGKIEIEFLRRLRDERKFPDSHALRTQILADIARARKYFRLLRLLQDRSVPRLAS